MYEIKILPKAAKYLKKLKDKPLKTAFKHAIDEIQVNPFSGELKTGDLSGVYCYDIYHNKTNYELAYSFVLKDNEYIIIILAGTRENFYKELKSYLKSGNIK